MYMQTVQQPSADQLNSSVIILVEFPGAVVCWRLMVTAQTFLGAAPWIEQND